jgi:hypothetical protein
MLIKAAILREIANGNVTLAFRRWQRPTVKTGSQIKTAIGLIDIDTIEEISESQINEADARRAGYDTLQDLWAVLNCGREGTLYRIALRYSGADPRLSLRETKQLSENEMIEVCQKLARLDKASKQGPWTLRVLRAIHDNPLLPAVQLADKTGFEKEWLKLNIRKLKELGLTISHQPGYEISPRGLIVLRLLSKLNN